MKQDNKSTNYGVWLVVAVAAVAIVVMWQVTQPRFSAEFNGNEADLSGEAIKGMPFAGIENPPPVQLKTGCEDSDKTTKNYGGLDLKKYTYVNLFEKGMVTISPSSSSGPVDECVDTKGNVVAASRNVREWYCRLNNNGQTVIEYKDIACPASYICKSGACYK
ncbi:hypothetical protein HYY69_07450 [Candidatus Woesearchaeota archaeon]|nr:hypothetical protein [Candidatus Woesearchaeota archaeon]